MATTLGITLGGAVAVAVKTSHAPHLIARSQAVWRTVAVTQQKLYRKT